MLVWGSVLDAVAADPLPIIARVEAHYSAVKTLRADFVQTVHSDLYGDDTQAGRLAIARPGRMRWDFTGDGRVYLITEDRVSIWTPAEGQLLRYPYTPSGADSLLQSLDHVDELFAVSAPAQPTDGGVVLDLTAKAGGGGPSVRLTLGPDLGLTRISLSDSMGTKTEIVFSHVVAGAPIEPSTWTLAVPPDARIIDGMP